MHVLKRVHEIAFEFQINVLTQALQNTFVTQCNNW